MWPGRHPHDVYEASVEQGDPYGGCSVCLGLHIQEIFGVEMEQVSLEDICLLAGTKTQALAREMI